MYNVECYLKGYVSIDLEEKRRIEKWRERIE